MTEIFLHGIHTSRKKAKSVTHVSGTECHLSLRSGTENQRLEAIANANGVELRTLWVEQGCKCDDDKKKEPVPVTVPEKKSALDNVLDHAAAHRGQAAAAGVVAVAIIGCSIVSFGACAAALGVAGGTTALAM